MNKLLMVLATISLMVIPTLIQAAHVHVSIPGFGFSPDSINITVGDTVTWTNNHSGIAHTSTSNTGIWNSGTLNLGQSFTFIFSSTGPGHFPYHCTFHPSMLGVVVVRQGTDINETQGNIQLPNKLTLSAYPNPFNPSTELSFSLPQEGQVSLNVYDITGRLVKSLLDARLPAGFNKVVWDGTDYSGNGISTGVYFVRLSTINEATIRRVVLLK